MKHASCNSEVLTANSILPRYIAIMEWQLTLLVGEEGHEIDTVPQVMANASPIFRGMLQPKGFVEGQDMSKTGSIVVRLPEDNVSAMTILCDIFHLRSGKIPIKDVTSDTMADIATLVDKYDCAAAIQPWPKLWLAQLLDGPELKDTKGMSLGEVGKWVHISCHLGYDELFSQMTSTLIRRASHQDLCQGPLLLDYRKLSQIIQGRVSLLERSLLLTFAESIENARYAGISSYYQLCFNLTETLKGGNHCKLANDGHYDNEEAAFDCSSIALGNAILAAKEICSGDNWELIENWTGSIDHYRERMKRFAERLGGPYRIFGRRSGYRHYRCSLSQEILPEIDTIYQNCTVGLKLEIVGNHVYRKAVSSGDEIKEEKSRNAM